jgi:predicted DNA-binding protein
MGIGFVFLPLTRAMYDNVIPSVKRLFLTFFSYCITSSSVRRKPIAIRLPEEIIERLDVVADRIGATRSMVIRFLVQTWVEHFEKYGAAALPPDWERLVDEMDGRTRAARTVASSSVQNVSTAMALIPFAEANLNEGSEPQRKNEGDPPNAEKSGPSQVSYKSAKSRRRDKTKRGS